MNPPSAFGTFRVLHQIGSGVLGPVFRSYDSQRERLVVVKAFKLDLVPEQCAAFADALRGIVAQPIDDPGIVRAVDAGLAGTTPFLALEFVSEDTLDALLRESREIAPSTVASLCRAMGRAVDAGWKVGTGHGALHPRDVFVRSADEVAITGFGVAQALQSVGMKAPVRRRYTAPERAAGGDWDCRADVYSLGAIAQELLARSGAASAEAGAVLEQALAERPAGRFPTALAMADALERAIAAAPLAVSSAAAATTNAHRLIAIDAGDETADPVADAPLRGLRGSEAVEAVSPITIDASPSMAAFAVPPYARESRPAFPWLATVAVAVACSVAGGLIGFRIGLSRGTDVRIERAVAGAGAVEVPAPQSARAKQPPAVPAGDSDPLPAAGHLLVESAPAGALVFVDGRRVGQTPVRVPNLAMGRHDIRVARSGFVPVTEEVSLSPSDPSRTVQVSLRRGGQTVTAAALEGSIEVDSRPRGAHVVVDGRAVGQTPVKVPAMSPGDHRVLIELVGHRRVTSVVKVVAGEQTRLAVSLEQTDRKR